MSNIRSIDPALVSNTNKLTNVQEIKKENVPAEKVLFNAEVNAAMFNTGIQLDAELKAIEDIDKMAEISSRSETEQKEFEKMYADAEIAGIGFRGLSEEDADYVFKVQNTFDNNDTTTLSAYRYTKNFDQKFYNLVLSNGIVYPDENEDCKVED